MILNAGKGFSRGLAVGAALGCLAAVIISVSNPYFVDSLWLGLMILWAFPAVVGALLWLVVAGLRRALGGEPSERVEASDRGALRPSTAQASKASGPPAFVIFILFAVVIGSLRLTAFLRESRVPSSDGSPCVFLLGLDGATWDIMEPMMAAGELPNLSALRSEGAWGILTSIDPTLSPAVWTTIATGKKRDKHGIRDFTYTQENLAAPRMWELLEAEGKKVGVQSWLVTWPPLVRNGFQIPGWLARTPETYPPELHFAQDLILGEGLARSPREYLAYLTDAPRIGVRLSTLAQALRLIAYSKLKHPPILDVTWRKDELKARIYADIFCRLLRKHKPDFSAVVFYGTDSLGHVYWKYMERLSSLGRTYSSSATGSDAGRSPSKAASTEITPPDSEGTEPDGESPKSASKDQTAVAGEVTVEEAERYGRVLYSHYRLMDSLLPRFLGSLPEDKTVCVVSDHGHGPREEEWGYVVLKSGHLLDTMGLAETVSCASLGDWNFLSPAPGLGLEALEEAARVLSSLTVTRTGEPFLDIEMTGSTSISIRVSYGTDSSDMLVTPQGEELPVADFVDEAGLSGTHTLSGVIILSGRGVKQGCRIEGAGLADVAPTLLYLMESTIGMDMDGRVLKECLNEGHLAAIPIRTVASRDDEVEFPEPVSEGDIPEAVRERLRALGYVK